MPVKRMFADNDPAELKKFVLRTEGTWPYLSWVWNLRSVMKSGAKLVFLELKLSGFQRWTRRNKGWVG